jgi:hypothetical protein
MKSARKRIASIVALLFIAAGGCVLFSGSPSSFRLNFPATVDLGELWLVEDVN